MERDQATNKEIEDVIRRVAAGLAVRIEKHGKGKFVSRAEAMGTLCEEYKESIDALQGNNLEEFTNEMMEVAIAASWAMLSLQETARKSDTPAMAKTKKLKMVRDSCTGRMRPAAKLCGTKARRKKY